MSSNVDLYNHHYGKFALAAQEAVRVATYGEDIGQSSWMTADELRRFIELLGIDSSSRVLEIGSGSGAPALFVAQTSGCNITGIDVNEHGIANANRLAGERGLDHLATFRQADASRALPLADSAFDAIICNDAICHIPARLDLLRECFRVLKHGGKILFTDAMIVTGLLTHEEIAARSSIGFYYFAPPGENERLLREAGFEILQVEDLTGSAASISKRWHDARAEHRDALVKAEGQTNFDGLQTFLRCVNTVSTEKRLSRFMYLAQKPR
jgi:ubiquinone/menaquinone biosynthesis C-methylase UbiE